jgi:hypothetical protein
MLMAHDCCCFILLFVVPHAVELSACMGVAGWGYCMSWSVVHKMAVFLELSKSAPISASNADDNTGFIIVMDARIVLLIVVSAMSAEKSLVWLHAFNSDK